MILSRINVQSAVQDTTQTLLILHYAKSAQLAQCLPQDPLRAVRAALVVLALPKEALSVEIVMLEHSLVSMKVQAVRLVQKVHSQYQGVLNAPFALLVHIQ